MTDIQREIRELEREPGRGLYRNDFLLSWEKGQEEIRAVLRAAGILGMLREQDRSCRVFDSGLGISLFRDMSTRTRFSFSSACNLLGLAVQDLDEKKSQIVHGETVRETSTMVSFMAETIGIRDCMNIGKGHTYMAEVARSVEGSFREGVLPQRPPVLNLQCDLDHPTQTLADLMHLAAEFGGLENLRGKKVAMSWAYAPSYGKPLSVPQGIIALLPRFGMDVVLAHPEGYGLQPETLEVAKESARSGGGRFTVSHSMPEAFEDADIVYPKSWGPYAAMETRTRMYGDGDIEGIDELEKEMLAENARHKDWECTASLMETTRDGNALYCHCLPADISGVSCGEGEVEASVFERYRVPLYREAGYKPLVIAAMILLGSVADPAGVLRRLAGGASGPRRP